MSPVPGGYGRGRYNRGKYNYGELGPAPPPAPILDIGGGYGTGGYGDGGYGDDSIAPLFPFFIAPPEADTGPRGIQQFYYSRFIPSRAVAIAKIEASAGTPADLTDINNLVYLPGSLGVWKNTTSPTSPADFVATDLQQSLRISGATQYLLENQFFELTNVTGSDGLPLFYVHQLPGNTEQEVRILDLDGVIQDFAFTTIGDKLYHSFDGQPYQVRYIDAQGFLHTNLLSYQPVMSEARYTAGLSTYVLGGRYLTVLSTGSYYIRFLASNGYQVLPAYNTPPNTPWFPRIRFSLKPSPSEWAKQIFQPYRPFVQAFWVPAAVLSSHLLEFERKPMLYDPLHLPDILIFDKNYAFKYALEGTKPGQPRRRGSLYNWKRGLIRSIDAYQGRVEVAVDLADDDIVFGFYSYKEQDLVYRGIDVNPYTNAAVRNRVVKFYYKNDGVDPFHVLYHQVLDQSGVAIAGLTNDPDPTIGTSVVFATLVVGASLSASSLTVTDIRERGGGLLPEWQDLPQAVNFWDLGYWDGKPYPIGGALAVYLPDYVLDVLSPEDVNKKVQDAIPMGEMAVIRYYRNDGSESADGVNFA